MRFSGKETVFNMPRLFTYIIPIDDGAAPNPFNGMCSLAICKPNIRKVAKKGDWIAGIGSKRAPSGDLSRRLVYAMCVEEVLTLKQYDEQARFKWPHRIPNIQSADLSERLGDCIYNYSSGKPVQRFGVHVHKNMKKDLDGKNVLISQDFYYFGSSAIPIRKDLLPICPQGQGHRSKKNDEYVGRFVSWLRRRKRVPGQLYGWPDYMGKNSSCGGCTIRQLDDEHDPDC